MMKRGLLLLLEFVLCALVAWLVTDWWLTRKALLQEPQEDEEEELFLPAIEEVTEPAYKNGKYHFTVKGVNAVGYLLQNPQGEEAARADSSGVFAVAPIVGGVYVLYALNKDGRQSDACNVKGCQPIVPRKISNPVDAKEFGEILRRNGKDSREAVAVAERRLQGRIVGRVKYEYRGLDEEEYPPASYAAIIGSLYTGWKAVRVISVHHNSEDKLDAAVIEVIYE